MLSASRLVHVLQQLSASTAALPIALEQLLQPVKVNTVVKLASVQWWVAWNPRQ
jgi:hypothetical protein